jgi:hypothetical protein
MIQENKIIDDILVANNFTRTYLSLCGVDVTSIQQTLDGYHMSVFEY